MLTSPWQVFLCGLAGSAVLELLHWYNLRRKPRLPAYSRRPLYWIITVLMMVAGGGLAWLYFGSQADAIITFHVGLSTPLILQKLTTTVANVPGGKGDDTSLASFFTW